MALGIGSWRFFLAFLVAISHLYAHMIDGYAIYAVWGFYTLSGYLMTSILKEKYGFSFNGLKSYYFNRWLRIYPAYWIAMVLGVVVLSYLHNLSILPNQLNPEFLPACTKIQWLHNFTLLLFLKFWGPGFYVPVANALSIEVAVYILMPLLAKNKSTAWFAFLISVFINCSFGFKGDSFVHRYSDFLPCLLPFTVGALISHYKYKFKFIRMPKLSFVVWVFFGLLWFKYPYLPWTYGLYVSIIISGWVIISLIDLKPSKADIMLGDLSYPIYLLHTTIAASFIPFYGYGRGLRFFVYSFILTIGVSLIVVICVERPLARQFKRKSSKAYLV